MSENKDKKENYGKTMREKLKERMTVSNTRKVKKKVSRKKKS